MDPLRYAKFFATTKHGDQKYGGLPYTHHLAAVELVLRRFGFNDEDILTAAWLHDVVEDTRDTPRETKVKDVAEMFGEEVAKLVAAVTNEPGENRKVRAALTYPKIRSTPRATALKLADRIANVEQGGAVGMYAKEQEDFRRALYSPGEYQAMWDHLTNLFDAAGR